MACYREQKIEASFEAAVEKVREALSEEGFSVPAEVDVTGAFQSALEKEFRPYLILLTGDPEMAYEAMTQDPNVGAVLPANVAIYEAEDSESSVVAVMEPGLLQQTGNPLLQRMGEAMEEVLSRLFARITA